MNHRISIGRVSLCLVTLGLCDVGIGRTHDWIAHHWWLDVGLWRLCVIWRHR